MAIHEKKRPTRVDKAEAVETVWRLIKAERPLSKRELAKVGQLSITQIGLMRSKWREIKDAGDDTLLKTTWTQALKWTAHDDLEQKMLQLAERLITTATELVQLVRRHLASHRRP